MIYSGKNLQSIPLECKWTVTKLNWGRDSVVDTATRYGLDGPGIETSPVQTGPVAYSASYKRRTVSLPGAKRPGSGVDHTFSSSAEVKNKVGLGLHKCSRVNFT